MAPGRRARSLIRVDALPGVELQGRVEFISPLAREKTGLVLYNTRIVFDAAPDLGLKSGMRATVEIIVGERSGVLLLPHRAITRDETGSTVVALLVSGEPEVRAVVTGTRGATMTEVLSGLAEGDVVVVEKAG